MAIDTDNKKLALIEWGLPWEPGLPLSTGAFSQGDQQQLIWGYPGILWSAPAATISDADCTKIAQFVWDKFVAEGLISWILSIQAIVMHNKNALALNKKCCEEGKTAIKDLYSAIRDIRQSQLRGDRDLRR